MPAAPPNNITRGATIPKGSGSKKTSRKNQRKSGRK